MIALLSDKVEFGRAEQPTRLAAMKVMQATRRVFMMNRDYSEFRNSLGQHVRHDPPWMLREWVLHKETRAERIGSLMDCKKCDEELSHSQRQS